MRVIGFMPIHYGKEYLKESLTSIKDHCEKVVVAYTPNGSHGYRSNFVCPDTEQDIFNVANEVLGDKLIWDKYDNYSAENEHRRRVHNYSHDYDLVLSIDADEVFEPKELNTALVYAYVNKERYYGIKGYVNFWRSFDYACYDGFRPIRIENLRAENNHQNLECPLTIYHFSTAQSEAIMRYKYNVFGHASEIRSDWLQTKHYAWTPENNFGDLHPVSLNLWNAVKFDKNKLPEFLKQHPNFDKKLI
jgi:hypothetical protein